MKLIDNKIFLEFSDLVACGVSENYLSAARSRGIKSLRFIDDPDDRRRVLIEYEPLAQRYKEKVTARYGNPYEFIYREPIRRMVIRSLEAENFYLSFRFENGGSLSEDHIRKFTIAASWLDMLAKVEKNKSEVKQVLRISLADFYTHVSDIIKSEGVYLPTKYQLLKERVKKYMVEGYCTLIEKWRFNNSFAAKISDDVSESVLHEMIADNRQFEDVYIARVYNKWASANGYNPISSSTVGNHRRKNEWQLQPYRDGNKAWYNKYGKHILRKRPSEPLLLVGGDGNDWDMFFQTERNGQIYHFDKYVLVVVMDAFNDYVLGWSIGKAENIQLIKAAWFDALQHINEITGGYYLPHDLQSDRFALATMKEFYAKLVPSFHPAAAKAPRGKYIERAFGTTWHSILKQYKNYSGHNITAASKINTDRINLEKRNFPHTSEAFNYALDFINQLRMTPDDKGATKQQQWLEAFEQSEKSKQRQITYEQFLLNFGERNSNEQTITNRGLSFQLNNESYLYNIPDENYLQCVGRKVQVIYDPYNMDTVLVTDGEKLRFLASVPYYLPAAKADQQPGDQQRLWKQLHQKKNHLQRIDDSKKGRELVLRENQIDAEALLQAGVLVKEIKQQAEQQFIRNTYNHNPKSLPSGADYDPLEQM